MNSRSMSKDQMKLSIKLKFFAMLREITGRREDRIQLQDRSTVKDALQIFCKVYGEKFREYVYDDEGRLRENLTLLVNGEAVNRDKMDKIGLKDGDTVVIMPPVGGGL